MHGMKSPLIDMHLFAIGILTATGINAASLQSKALGPRAIFEPDLHMHELVTRDVPPCTPCVPDDRTGYATAQQIIQAIDPNLLAEAQATVEYPQAVDATYRPPICDVSGINCAYLGQGVEFKYGGLTPPVGHWTRGDGTQIIAWTRWQSTLLFAGPGGSGTVYPAHCCVYPCAKGRMQVQIIDEGQTIQGDGRSDNGAQSNCNCFYGLDDDFYFSIF